MPARASRAQHPAVGDQNQLETSGHLTCAVCPHALSALGYFARPARSGKQIIDCAGFCPSTASRRKRPIPIGDLAVTSRARFARTRFQRWGTSQDRHDRENRLQIVPGSARAQHPAAGVQYQLETSGHLTCAVVRPARSGINLSSRAKRSVPIPIGDLAVTPRAQFARTRFQRWGTS